MAVLPEVTAVLLHPPEVTAVLLYPSVTTIRIHKNRHNADDMLLVTRLLYGPKSGAQLHMSQVVCRHTDS
jgi:hypothetical protein